MPAIPKFPEGAKFSEKIAAEIPQVLELHERGYMITAIHKKTGLDRETVRKIFRAYNIEF